PPGPPGGSSSISRRRSPPGGSRRRARRRFARHWGPAGRSSSSRRLPPRTETAARALRKRWPPPAARRSTSATASRGESWRRGRARGMSVAGLRRRPARGGPPGVRWVGGLGDLPRLAAESDCLVIAAPHTAETRGAVTRGVLEQLPQGAIVVNVSRGTLLDETAVLDLLDASRLLGAA